MLQWIEKAINVLMITVASLLIADSAIGVLWLGLKIPQTPILSSYKSMAHLIFSAASAWGPFEFERYALVVPTLGLLRSLTLAFEI